MKDFTIVRRGFDTTEVDSYIAGLENEIEKRDKAIARYREQEDAINRAVIEAQLTADSILKKANEDAARIHSDAASELGAIRAAALKLRSNLAEFQESYNRLLRRYLYTGHCEDMTQIYDRLDSVLKLIDVDPESTPPMPELQSEPVDATGRPIPMESQSNTGSFSLDDIRGALIDSKF